jgi:hypothetical protein
MREEYGWYKQKPPTAFTISAAQSGTDGCKQNHQLPLPSAPLKAAPMAVQRSNGHKPPLESILFFY